MTRRAGGSELRGLAPRRGTDLQYLLARDRAKQTGRQRCRRILHPPLTRLVTSQPRHLAGAPQPECAAGQTLGGECGAERFGSVLRIGARREVERRLLEVGFGDGPAARVAVSLGPALPEPVRRVEAGRVELCDRAVFAGGPTQHCVDKSPVGRKPRSFCERDGARHRRVRRRLQEGELGDTEPKHVLHRPAPCG